MALRNPYSTYARTGDVDERQALLDALDEPPPPPRPMTAQPRTPSRTPQQTREMLEGPGGRTQAVDTPDTSNAFTGDRWTDERPGQDVYQSPPTTQGQTGAQPREASNMSRGYQLMDEYDDAYTRRNEGPGGALSNGARWAQTGATVGSVVPGVGTAVGGIVGGVAGLIGGAFTKNAKSAMTDFAIEDARQIISQAHKDAFGRDITPESLDSIVRGQGWEDGDRWMGEKQLAYVLDQFAQQAPGDRAAQAAANAAAAAPAAGPTTPPGGAQAGATGGGLPFSGFDFNRAQDPSKSAKDAFASLAQQAPPLTDTSKAGAEAWFREHIAPGMEAAGYKVFNVQGDKAWVGAREDPEGRVPVDFLINAGGSNPQIGWQPDSGGGGGGATGDAPGDIAGAYDYLKSIAHPGMSRAEMESAVTQAFGNVPGFEKAYAGDVVINGRKIDLITNFEGPGATWSDNLSFVPLHGGGSPTSAGGGAGLVGGSGLNLAPNAQLAAPLGRSDVNAQIMAELQRLLNGQPPRDELLEALG
jgi:hypothetical protein